MLKNIEAVLVDLCIQISVLMGYIYLGVKKPFKVIGTELWLLVSKIRMYEVIITEDGIYTYKLPQDEEENGSSR